MDAQASFRLKRALTEAAEEGMARIPEADREAFIEQFCNGFSWSLYQAYLTWRYNRLAPPKG